ncbi:MAG: ABC transporter permease [Nitrospinae bacterium]|nr:ABC transporter permease [Nitrospinota bacterium]
MANVAEAPARPSASFLANFNYEKYGLLVVFIMMMIIFYILQLMGYVNNFIEAHNLTNQLRNASILFFIVAGQSMVLLVSGIDLSQGSLLSLSSVVMAQGILDFGLAVGVLMGIGMATMFGFINGYLVGRVKIQPFIVTLSMLFICAGIALVFTGGRTIHQFTGEQKDILQAIGLTDFFHIPGTLFIAIFFFIILYLLTKRTVLGRAIYLTGGNEEAARLSGIDTGKVKLICYLISGICVGITSFLYLARLPATNGLAGFQLEFQSLAATVVGGTTFHGGEGGVTQAAIGTLFLTFLLNGLILLGVGTFAREVVVGVLLITAVVLSSRKRRE